MDPFEKCPDIVGKKKTKKVRIHGVVEIIFYVLFFALFERGSLASPSVC